MARAEAAQTKRATKKTKTAKGKGKSDFREELAAEVKKAEAAEDDKADRSLELVGTHQEELPVPLTEGEVNAKAMRCAQIESELADLAARKKQATADIKAEETRLSAERSKLSLQIRQQQELRPVLVREERDYHVGELREVRSDTGTIIRRRPLAENERQQGLFPRDEGEDASVDEPSIPEEF